ncbi:MAG: FumA C-terminus/TtdB family hydratase beta subunit [Erysipelotrichaceae bacterium]
MELHAPFTKEKFHGVPVGTIVYLTGTIYTARDAAHARLTQLLETGEALPFPVENSLLYYVGPTPKQPGHAIGSCGPTTASRMDRYTPALLDLGLTGTIGKGYRSAEVIASMEANDAVYLVAIGGAGAYLSKCVKASRVVAFEDLGPEAIYALEVERFPVTLCIDAQGNNLYFSEIKV